MLLINSDGMFLIEIKGHDFTKIYVNSPWMFFNSRKGKENELLKTVKRVYENPYDISSCFFKKIIIHFYLSLGLG